MKKPNLEVLIRASWILILFGLVGSCAPRLSPPLPPADYKGPIAEQPIEDSGYVWVYESAHGRRGTRRNLFGNYGFPLWVGKSWSYEGGAYNVGADPRNTRLIPEPTDVYCEVLSFKQITVIAGSFGAFECQCTCELSVVPAGYESFCGRWTLWYAPEVKNTIRRDTEASDRNWELVDWE